MSVAIVCWRVASQAGTEASTWLRLIARSAEVGLDGRRRRRCPSLVEGTERGARRPGTRA